MDKLVPILNQLQSVLGIQSENSISLPQLVVVGSQSSGKSSVLENIVGRDFLPRGNNIVTRRPLVLQLYNTSFTTSKEEYGTFEHTGDKRFDDFAEIKKEIGLETEKLLGRGSNISKSPIYLRIYSPNVPTLTLVDQPGIVKVATGDQPANIEKLTKEMILHFISNPNAIIVAVSSATEDIANSEALKMAKQVDPQGSRTLSVLTKLDLMDQGTDARRVQQNAVIPLQLGHCGVINRSQKDINENKAIQLALDSEKAYFQNSVYTGFTNVGTSYLSGRLSTLLLASLQTHLPSIKQKVLDTLKEAEKELQGYGNPFGMDGYNQMVLESGEDPNGGIPASLHGQLLLNFIGRFSKEFTDAIEGRGNGAAFHSVRTKQQYGGARIAFVFHTTFCEQVDSIDPFDNLSDQEIRLALQNATGTKRTLFLPEAAFEGLVRRQIERLRAPVFACLALVVEELKRVAQQCIVVGLPQLERFHQLKSELTDTFSKEQDKRLIPTRDMITNQVNMELAYINTNHPDFIGGSKALANLALQRKQKKEEHQNLNNNNTNTKHMDLLIQADIDRNTQYASNIAAAHGVEFRNNTSQLPKSSPYGNDTSIAVREAIQKPLSERETVEIEVSKLLIASYYSIVKKTIKDIVPKTIMYLLVDKTQQDIQNKLVESLYKQDKFATQFTEAKDIGEKRESCVKLVNIMKKALEVVERIKDAQI